MSQGETPDVWVDKGPIGMPEGEHMKIPLTDGWQLAKLDARRHPISKRAEATLNEIHETFYAKGRMDYSNEVSPFALPISVVYCTAHGVEKGRAVTKLRHSRGWWVSVGIRGSCSSGFKEGRHRALTEKHRDSPPQRAPPTPRA